MFTDEIYVFPAIRSMDHIHGFNNCYFDMTPFDIDFDKVND